ncbi:hypothetical protein EBR44_12785 [bacterium]|nr:hypothetical protein [bacterium]
MVPDRPWVTFRDAVGGIIAVLVIGAICWSALYDGSQSSQTALVGAAGAVTGWLFRGSGQATNGNGYTNGSAGSGGGASTPAA